MLRIYIKLINYIETLINIIIVISFSYKRIHLNQNKDYERNNSSIVHILGNGPSLIKDLSIIKSTINNNTSIMAVNSFACTNLYEEIKPNLYIIVDSAYFRKSNNDRITNIQKKITISLLEKTKWPLTLFLPNLASKTEIVRKLQENKNIKISYFQNIPVIGGNYKLNNFFFKYNLANPMYQNVLIAAIFTCIKLSFQRIVIWGADHSWHESYTLGKDNIIYTPDRHFYNDQNYSFAHLNNKGIPIKVYEEFETLARTFRIYHSLESFSKKNKCTIKNMSNKTWIDAFDRE